MKSRQNRERPDQACQVARLERLERGTEMEMEMELKGLNWGWSQGMELGHGPKRPETPRGTIK